MAKVMALPKAIGSRIRQLRETAGLTQPRLAELAFGESGDKYVMIVSRLELGSGNVRFDRLKAVSDVLAVALKLPKDKVRSYIGCDTDELDLTLRPRFASDGGGTEKDVTEPGVASRDATDASDSGHLMIAGLKAA